MNDNILNINITSGTIIRTILLSTLFYVLYLLGDLILVILTSVVVASSIEPLIKWVQKYNIHRILATIFSYAFVITILFGFFFLFVPPLLDEVSVFIADNPQYLDSVKLWNPLKNSGVFNSATTSNISGGIYLPEVIEGARSVSSGATEGSLLMIGSFFGGILSFFLIIVLSFYLAVQESGIVNFLRIVTPVEHEKYVIDLWKRSQAKIGLWMQGQILLAVLIGVLVYLGLTILGIKYAFLLALLAMVAELIPIFGPIISAIPGIAIGFTTGGTPLGLVVLGFYIIIQQFENHLIYPLVVKKVIGIHPLVVIIALIIGIKLAGFIGVILSVPIATAVMEFVEDREKKKRAEIR